jgi:DNA-binding NtrC family response regulator
MLARNFLAYYNDRYACRYEMTPANEAALLAYSWPGNVRELANALERAVVLASGEGLVFQFEDSAPSSAAKPAAAIKEKKQAVEREEILKSLETNRWNKTQTAEALGMSRRSLLYKIKEYGIA